MRRLPLFGLVLLTVSCASRVAPRASADPGHVDVSQMWVEPRDLESRNLFYGPGDRTHAPNSSERFEIVAVDTSGYSDGYDVRDPDGRTWSVKIGKEAQPEVAVSRILWAIGYHQPSTYLLTNWTADDPHAKTSGAARFRPQIEGHKVVDEWSWYDNPFVNTQQFRGLIVANLLLNNWDWKTSNNKIYEVFDDSGGPQRQYVVRDLGASLGKTNVSPALKWMQLKAVAQGSRNELDDFEAQGFIKRVSGDKVTFVYKGIHPQLLKGITVDDVTWTCALMNRLSDEQLHQAFLAAGYSRDDQDRYVRRIRAKIQEGKAAAQTAAVLSARGHP